MKIVNSTPTRYYYLKDHLGSIKMPARRGGTVNTSGGVVGWDDYYPFGMTMPTRSSNNASIDGRFKFTEKERDVAETGYDYFGARTYDSFIARWLQVDPLADKYPWSSPYVYCLNNPVNIIDPNGDSTFVVNNDDGTYTVTGGNLSGADDDTGVYIKNSDGTVTLVGNSLTTHSFFDDEGNAVVGAVIDPASTEGQDFVDGLIAEGPSLISYMANGKGGEKYDFKLHGKKPAGMTLDQYKYRGSVAANGAFGSARDFGNIGAGIMAGRSGFSWAQSRIAFDFLESLQRGKPAIEGTPTQKAQRIGFSQGFKLWFKDAIIRMRLLMPSSY